MSAKYATLDEARTTIFARGVTDPAWAAKMLHLVPDLPTVPDRMRYLVEKATDKVVLDLGCTGKISAAIRAAAHTYYGVDKMPGPGRVAVDLDERPEALPIYPDVEIIIASELLEHLANPGRFLLALRVAYLGRDVYLTVPHAGAYTVQNGTHEVVNGEHVAWYSYTTLETLLRRAGYRIESARWYHGEPHKAEGLIVVAR